jgi:hypothetical protein
MKKAAEDKRTERIVLLFNPEEFTKLKKLYARSASKTPSRYVRKVSLEEPVEIVVRNLSFDAFVEEVIRLRRELGLIRTKPLSRQTEEVIVRLHENIRININKIADLCMPQ